MEKISAHWLCRAYWLKFVYYVLKKHQDILLVNLDKLTYDGKLEGIYKGNTNVWNVT